MTFQVQFHTATTETLIDKRDLYISQHGANAYKDELKKRATEEDGIVDTREQELIDKVTNGPLKDADRAELINILPARSKQGSGTENYSDDSIGSLLDETKLVGKYDLDGNGSIDGVDAHDTAAINELRKRATESGKMTPELNALLHKAQFSPEQLTDKEHARLGELMGV